MIVLASKSPRRKEILKDLGYDFIVCPAKKDEVFDLSLGLDEALKKVAEIQGKRSKRILFRLDYYIGRYDCMFGSKNIG